MLGGTLSALGIAAIFMQGGSTGGTDIIALIVAKYRETSPGRVFLYCDLMIIGSIYLLPGKSLQDVIYGSFDSARPHNSLHLPRRRIFAQQPADNQSAAISDSTELLSY